MYNQKQPKCPFCKWFLRLIDSEMGLYECSDPRCNCIIEYTHNSVKPKKTIKQEVGLNKWGGLVC